MKHRPPGGRPVWGRAIPAGIVLVALIASSGVAAAGTTPPSTPTPPTSAAPTTSRPTTSAGPTTTAASISVSPVALTVPEGRTATFRAFPTGTGGITWQSAAAGGGWRNAGVRGNVLSVAATRAQDGHRFRAVLSDGATTATSTPVTLHVRVEPTPTTTTTPTPTPVAPGGPAVPSTTPSTSAPSDPPPDDRLFGTVARPELPQGLDQTATAHGFAPGSRVRVTLEPGGVALGTPVAAADGTVTTRFSTIGLVVGIYTVTWTPA